MVKIGWGQLLILLLLGRIFTIMTYTPIISSTISIGTQMIAILISTFLQAIFVIPILCISAKYPNIGIIQLIKNNNNKIGFLVGIFYLMFIVILGAISISHFCNFMGEVVFPTTNKYIFAVSILAVAVYGAFLGIQGISRVGVIVFVFFLVMTAFVVIASFSEIQLLAFMPNFRVSSAEIFSIVIEDLSRSGELILAVLLLPFVNFKRKTSIFGYLAGKIIILDVILFLIITILGEFSTRVTYPFFALASYSELAIINRMDAFYMVLWCLTSVIKLSVIVFVGGEILKTISKKVKYCNLFVGTAIILMSMLFLTTKFQPPINNIVFASIIILLLFLIPIAIIILGKDGKKLEKNSISNHNNNSN